MKTDPYRLAVLVGSVRKGRRGIDVARWFVSRAARRADLHLDVVDLADYRHQPDMTGHADVERFAARLAGADAIVVVTPEYNHSYPGPLKTAIDSVRSEWRGKPVAFVAYGGLAGGLRAVEALRVVFAELHATTIRETVSIHQAGGRFGPDGSLLDPAAANQAATALLDQLGWWARALRHARAAAPYPVSW